VIWRTVGEEGLSLGVTPFILGLGGYERSGNAGIAPRSKNFWAWEFYRAIGQKFTVQSVSVCDLDESD
jgi:hypothetical protein